MLLDGEDILADCDLSSLRFRVGWLFQKRPHFRCDIRNVAFGLRLDVHPSNVTRGRSSRTRMRHVDEVRTSYTRTPGSPAVSSTVVPSRVNCLEQRSCWLDSRPGLDPISTLRVEEISESP